MELFIEGTVFSSQYNLGRNWYLKQCCKHETLIFESALGILSARVCVCVCVEAEVEGGVTRGISGHCVGGADKRVTSRAFCGGEGA